VTKILVIRRDNIGDLVCATPLLAALRRRHPNGHLAVLANSYNAPILEGNPDVDVVYSYAKLKHRRPGDSLAATLWRTLRLMLQLRREAFDYVVLAKSGFDRHGLAWARRIAALHIVGFAPPGEPAARAIDTPVAPPEYHALHEVEVMMLLAQRLGASREPGPVSVKPNEPATAQWRERLPRLAQRHRRWIAFHVSTRDRRRLWPEARCVALIKRLVGTHGTGVVLLWAPGASDDPRHPGDDARAASILRDIGHDEAVLPARTATLAELTGVLSLCDAFIGPDGGAMHVAAGLGLPIVAFFENNAGKMRHWHPWGVPYELVYPKTGGIPAITPQQVEDAWLVLASQLAAPTTASAR
jgi:ADP-heptose:LPS heptosyltransferase